MILEVMRRLALQLAVEHPEMEMPVHLDESEYKGRGNPCAIIGIICDELGLTREQRLELLAAIFERPALATMKDLKVAELQAVYRLRAGLGEAWQIHLAISSVKA